MSTATITHRSREDWTTLAQEILPAIQAEGGLTQELRDRYGITQLYRLRIALAQEGFDIQGNPLMVRPIQSKRPSAIAREISMRRKKGEPYWLLEVETGMSPTKMQNLMRQHGFEDTASTDGNGS